MVVYLWHSGEAELGTGLFIFHTFPPNPFQRVLGNPSDKFPRAQKNPSAYASFVGKTRRGEQREGGMGIET